MPVYDFLRPEPVLNDRFKLGEGPLWDPAMSSLFWLDILNKKIHRFSIPDQQHISLDMPEMVGTIALSGNGKLLAALQSGLYLTDKLSGENELLVNPEPGKPDNRFNDGKVDPAGRMWVGTLALDESKGAGNLYLIDKNLSVTKKIANTTIANGMAWSPDLKTFYFIDTPSGEVAAYDYDNETGEIKNRRAVISIPDGEGSPDGMTIDREGRLWIAHFGGWQVSRWDPATGEKLMKIDLPVSQVTCCCFGGDDLNDLYITTAYKGLDEEQLEKEPLAGTLFVVKNCGFTGMDTYVFGGA